MFRRSSHHTIILNGFKISVPAHQITGLPLIDLQNPVHRMDDIVLDHETRVIADHVLHEHHQRMRLDAHGLRAPHRLLLCGPSGCGKSLMADILASELGRPLAIVQHDVLMSFPDYAAIHLRRILEFASSHSVVMVFDHFLDQKSMHTLHTAFFQALDAYENDSILIVTLQQDHQDIALNRMAGQHFDEIMNFKLPSAEQIEPFLSIKLRDVRQEFDLDDESLAPLFDGMNYREIEHLLLRARKNMIFEGADDYLALRHLKWAVRF